MKDQLVTGERNPECPWSLKLLGHLVYLGGERWPGELGVAGQMICSCSLLGQCPQQVQPLTRPPS